MKCLLYRMVFLFVSLPLIYCQTISDAKRLVMDLLTNYSSIVRPVQNQSEHLDIDVGFLLFSIDDFNEISGTISWAAGISLSWTDYGLTWDPPRYGGLEQVVVPKVKIWMPNIFLANPAKKMKAIGSGNFAVRLFASGNVTWSPGGVMKSPCKVDMTYFPFDSHTCEVVLAAWDYLPNEVILSPHGNIDFTYFRQNQIWDVKGSKMERYALGRQTGLVRVEMTLARKPLYYCLTILAPICLLCLLNPLVFVLPLGVGERVSFAVTIFLSFAVFMTVVNDTMPKVSEPMSRLSYLIFISMAHSCIVCVLAIFTTRIYLKNDNSNIPWIFRKCNWFSNGKDRKFLCCRKKFRPKVDNAAFTNSDANIVTDIHKSESSGETCSEDNTSNENSITWQDIAICLDRGALTGSVVFVICLCLLLSAP